MMSASASAGLTSASKSGPISRAASIMSARRCSVVRSPRSLQARCRRAMRPEPEAALSHRTGVPRPRWAERIGLARLTRAAEAGHDLRPLWRRLIARLLDGSIEAGEGLDLALIAPPLGHQEAGH